MKNELTKNFIVEAKIAVLRPLAFSCLCQCYAPGYTFRSACAIAYIAIRPDRAAQAVCTTMCQRTRARMRLNDCFTLVAILLICSL